MVYCWQLNTGLQGRVKFPTGGRVRERELNRCDSGTDSTVWMEEDNALLLYVFHALSPYSGRILIVSEAYHG